MKIRFPNCSRTAIRILPLIILTSGLCGFSHAPSSPYEYIEFSRNEESAGFQPNQPLPAPLAAIWKEKKPAVSGVNLWTTSSTMRTNIRIPLRSAALFLESRDELLERTALSLIKKLNIRGLQTVRLYAPGKTLPPGTIKPDIFLRLRSESNGETNRVCLLGGSAYLDDIQPLSNNAQFSEGRWSMEVELSLTPSFLSRPPSTQIMGWKCGEELAKAVTKEIHSITEKYGVVPEFPKSFVPDWQPAPDLAFLNDFNAREIISTRENLTFNTTAWIFTSPKSPQNLLSALSARLQKEGWAEDRLFVNDTNQILEVEKKDEGLFLRIIDADEELDVWLGGDLAKQRAAGDKPYFVIFSHLMSHNEIQPIIDPFFNGSPTPAQAMGIAMYQERQGAGVKEMKPVFPVLRKLAPDMSAADLFRLAKWIRYATYPYEEKTRYYFIQSVLKNLWGDYNKELEKEQDDWAKRKSFIKELLPVQSLPCRLSVEEQLENGIRPLEEVLGTEYSLAVGEPFAVSVSTNQVQCWNVYRKEQSLIHRKANHKTRQFQYFYESIESGKAKEKEVELSGKMYSVTTRTDPHGETWKIRIVVPHPGSSATP